MTLHPFTAFTLLLLGTSPIHAAGPATLLDDFESEPKAWKFVGGQEFPGAKGSFIRDSTIAHGGRTSAHLRADFNDGGAYVGIWRDLAGFDAVDLAEIRFWVRTRNIASIGFRINDATGQCHQRKRIPLRDLPGWQELVLKISDLVGGEHWGGANDGKWHGPPAGFGINISTDDITEGRQGELWLDDVRAGIIPSGTPTLHGCLLSQPQCRPGYGVRVTYRWDAQALAPGCKAFVHVRSPDGKIVIQGDHDLPSAGWSGRVEYDKLLVIPTSLPVGDYPIIAGIWNPGSGKRVPVKAAGGAVANGSDACQVGILKIATDAPIPALPAPSLDLGGYQLTFDEDFTDQRLDVSAWGPGTRWIAHTPYGGDFGDARFADPRDGFPFTIENGILRIEARRIDGKWQAGLLSSVDRDGRGFAQKFGYFEMRAKFPKGEGVWPAFWLLSQPGLKDRSITRIEIDVVEFYGVRPNTLSTHIHFWGPGKKHRGDGEQFIVPGMTDDFHRYGVMIEPDFTSFYFDGIELRRTTTPEEAKVPLYLLANLALGGGWPIDKTPDPSHMFIDYIRCYAR